MRKTFFEYYSLSDREVNTIWENCLLILDTNVLLNLYRYSPSTRDDLLRILRVFSDRLWLPYQVGWEYHNNREAVLKNTYGLPQLLKEEITKTSENFLNEFKSKYIRNPLLSYDSLEKKINKLSESLLRFIDDKFKDASGILKEDSILGELDDLYEGRVGDDFTEEELHHIFDEGARRFDNKIPPGYKDEAEKKNKGQRHLFGDLIIWKEIINKSKAAEKDVFFVSDDLKEDWLRIENGQKKGPRRELLREFWFESGGRSIVIMTQQGFLDFIHGLPDYTVKSSTRREVEASKINLPNAYTNVFNDGVIDRIKTVLSMYESIGKDLIDADLLKQRGLSSSSKDAPGSFYGDNETPGGEENRGKDEDEDSAESEDGSELI
jgi:hypothetical protein